MHIPTKAGLVETSMGCVSVSDETVVEMWQFGTP